MIAPSGPPEGAILLVIRLVVSCRIHIRPNDVFMDVQEHHRRVKPV